MLVQFEFVAHIESLHDTNVDIQTYMQSTENTVDWNGILDSCALYVRKLDTDDVIRSKYLAVLYQVLNKQVPVPVPVVQVPVQVPVPNLHVPVPVPVQVLCINYWHSVTLQLQSKSCGIFHNIM